MNAPALFSSERLPDLLDRASKALAEAKSSAEVLEARDKARVAYDAAKSAGRVARAKTAHDEVLAALYRAQADALQIEARAKVRLADEIDAARVRGELATDGRPKTVPVGNGFEAASPKPTTAELGLTRKEVHEARQLRDAERANPGLIQRALDGMTTPQPERQGPKSKPIEPTRAELRRSVLAAVKDARRRPDFRNPIKVKDPGEEAYTQFVGACRDIEDADLPALAAWRGHHTKVSNLRARAMSARDALSHFLSLGGSDA